MTWQVRWSLPGILLILLLGCAEKIPREALVLSTDLLSRRQLQTRVYETENETALLSASSALLQDLGFNLDESETRLGVITASKDRTAVEAGQVVAAVFVAALTGAAMPYDKRSENRELR